MPDWNDIFTNRGRVFLEPHPDMEKLASLFKAHNFTRLLDLGCGTGRHLLYFSKQGFEVYGLDSSPKGLEIAKSWLIEENEKAELTCQRIEHVFPYPNEYFDTIISIQVIHHNYFEDIIFTAQEVDRILKPNGMIFITVPILNVFSRGDWDLKKVEKRTFIPQKGQEKGLPHHFFTISEFKSIFKSFNLMETYVDKTNHRAFIAIKNKLS
ncbi:MAG: class I SAM-dependent methyltransferase [Candidatus Thorarchaeota archaeon]